MSQLLVAGLFATAFATIYIWGTWEAIDLAIKCSGKPTDVGPCIKSVTDIPHLSYILTTVGNVISGGVVGILAFTRKNELPAARFLDADPTEIAKRVASYIPLAFIVVWVGCGMATVIFGLINNPEVVPPLTAQAKGWIGSAATALLAYLAPAPGPNPPPLPHA
jgi:hypothetical protein